MPTVLAAGILTAVAATPAGCATYACNGPEVPFPAIYVDAGPWFDAHRTRASVEACLETTCEKVARASSPPSLETPRGTADAPHEVVVTLRADGRTSTERLTVTLGATSLHGPCGTVSFRGRVVTVGADGALTAEGVLPDTSARQTRRASTTSSPTPSPTG